MTDRPDALTDGPSADGATADRTAPAADGPAVGRAARDAAA